MTFLPTLTQAAAISFTVGALAGGGGVWYARGLEVGRLELKIERMEAANALAQSLAKSQAEAAELTIAGLQSDLARAHVHSERVYVEVEKRIEAVASPRRQCLSAPTVRVLRDAADPPAQGADPRSALGIPAAPAADPDGSASEQAIARWMNAALRQYKDLRDRHRALAEVVRALPCVVVE